MFYYITVLSNWLEGYSKYSQEYSKRLLDKSTFPDKFFLVKEDQQQIGLAKAERLLARNDIYFLINYQGLSPADESESSLI